MPVFCRKLPTPVASTKLRARLPLLSTIFSTLSLHSPTLPFRASFPPKLWRQPLVPRVWLCQASWSAALVSSASLLPPSVLPTSPPTTSGFSSVGTLLSLFAGTSSGKTTQITFPIQFDLRILSMLTLDVTVSNPRAELWKSWSGCTSSPTLSRLPRTWTRLLSRATEPLRRRSRTTLELE